MTTDLSGAYWFKCSYSSGQTDCVEIARLPDGRVGVRDLKNAADRALVFEPGAWDAFARRLGAAFGP
ncbi:DUF397 domain-containing protein [Nocardia testacea]|uniref:DUF397 domain-containing protein n=1 Tax=Nocardia testacea TaxID=248551 RepID=UPI0033EC30B2